MGSSSSPLRRKLGFRTLKTDRGVARADTVMGRILRKEVGDLRVYGSACKVTKVELQPDTCPGQMGDGEEVDAEWEVQRVTGNLYHPGELRRGITTLFS